MNLPTRVLWPDSAITFMLMGGNDNFRGNFSHEAYVEETRRWVPRTNRSTAILYVNEMEHMPQTHLLGAILKHMLRALMSWKSTARPPLEGFRRVLVALSQDGWSGRLLYTSNPGAWEDIKFSRFEVGRLPAPTSPEHKTYGTEPPPEFTSHDELKALWRAASLAAAGGQVPYAPGGGRRLAAVVNAACQIPCAAAAGGAPGASGSAAARLTLPISAVGGQPQAARAVTSPANFVGSGYASNRASFSSQDPTPISRALGLNHRFGSRGSTPASPNSPFGFFELPTPTPRVSVSGYLEAAPVVSGYLFDAPTPTAAGYR